MGMIQVYEGDGVVPLVEPDGDAGIIIRYIRRHAVTQDDLDLVRYVEHPVEHQHWRTCNEVGHLASRAINSKRAMRGETKELRVVLERWRRTTSEARGW